MAKQDELVTKEQECDRLKADIEELSKEEIALGESISDADAKKQDAAQVDTRVALNTPSVHAYILTHPSRMEQTDNFLVFIPVALFWRKKYLSHSVPCHKLVEPPHIPLCWRACIQSIASLETELKKYREQRPILQEELTKARHSYREKALRTIEEHEVQAEIDKAQEFGSELPLLKNVYLAHMAVVKNKNAMTKAEHQLAQSDRDMREQGKKIASLKAERKQISDKVLVWLS